MNSPSIKPPAVLTAAVQRVKTTFRSTLDRSLETMGVAASTAARAGDRENLRVALFELGRRQASFAMTFNERLDESITQELRKLEGQSTSLPREISGSTFWESLTLVSQSETELEVAGERIAQAIAHDCEWELRRAESLLIGALRSVAVADEARNPLRPDIIGKAVAAACATLGEKAEVTDVLRTHVTRAWTAASAAMYKEIADALQQAGVRPADVSVRTVQGPGNEMGTSTYQTGVHGGVHTAPGVTSMAPNDLNQQLAQMRGNGVAGAGRMGGDSVRGGFRSSGYHGGGAGDGTGNSQNGGLPSIHGLPDADGVGGQTASRATGWQGQSTGSGRGSSGRPIRSAVSAASDAQLVMLLKRLAMHAPVERVGTVPGALTDALTSQPGALPVLPNLIANHREELRQAATGTLDHMVIDVVASLFDQILSDTKVPPQMARQIARLQLPVLRVALIDATFFSSRRHPVRRFVNRIASLAVAFEDFSEGPGQKFHEMVRNLVDEIAASDFDQMQQYQQKLAVLEEFAANQAKSELENTHRAPSLLDDREAELLLQQRYVQQLKAGLSSAPMDDYLRDFITQVWSQALMRVGLRHGPQSGMLKTLRTTGRDLVLSVQPKGSPNDRKNFLVRLPQLMKELDVGVGLIGWPEDAKREFVAKLRASQVAAMNQPPMTVLDYNLLSKQIEAVLGTPLPTADQAPAGTNAMHVLEERATPAFTPDEANRIGLLDETKIDWDGQVDIDITGSETSEASHANESPAAEPANEEGALTELDINIDGLPAPEPMEPTRGAELMNHVQVGFSYRMHFENRWHKVRLAHISPGRTFFVFTRGAKHEHAISMTARMISRLCESGRLRTYENAHLIERATARARAQLAAIRGGSAASTGSEGSSQSAVLNSQH